MINLKKELISILEKNITIDSFDEDNQVIELYEDNYNDVIKAMREFATLACEEQKRICAKEARVTIIKNLTSNSLSNCYLRDVHDYTLANAYVNKNSILNSSIVKFE